MLRALCVDDHAIFRQGVKQILGQYERNLKVGEASTATEAMRLLREDGWDVVILDLSLPDRSGFQLLAELKREQPELPVIVLSMHADDEYAIRAVRGGAAGYVTKESAPEELVVALRKVMRGGKYMTPALAEKVAFAVASPGALPKPHHTLSEREMEVLRLIGAGKSLKEIAAILSVSVKSVGTYRSRVLEKMRLQTNADLIRYVIENGLRV
ncbi:MAG TPA: response regulator transcription factor [Thermoanaerobaculia bacterium]|nr:response regulator transcription factor [Thermoanaerobaculia bacterium]